MEKKEKLCLQCMNETMINGKCSTCGWLKTDQAQEPFHLVPGIILHSRYLLGMAIKSGGFGIIYHGYDLTLQQHIAIKEFYPQGVVNRSPKEKELIVFSGSKKEAFKTQLRRFLEEGRILAKFSDHPNIVKVYDFFEENNTAYIIMEYLDGVSLRDYLEMNPILPYDDMVNLILPVIDALEAMHKQHIIHRDVNPNNIFITYENQTKLLDLGAARLSNEETASEMTVVLTPGYAPDEQYQKDGKQGAYTDVYSVCATMYRMITGIAPEESNQRRFNETLIPPSVVVKEIPKEIESVILRGMATDKKLRFKTMQELKEALLSNKIVASSEKVAKTRKLFRFGIIITSIVMLCTIGGVLWYNLSNATETLLDASEIEFANVKVALVDTTSKEAMIEIEKLFEEKYPNIDLEFNYISELEYQQAIDTNQYNVYRYDLAQSNNNADMTNLYGSINTKNYLIIKENLNELKKLNYLPTSFVGPTLYLNRYLADTLVEIDSDGKTFEEYVILKDSYPGLTGFQHLYVSYNQVIPVAISMGIEDITGTDSIHGIIQLMKEVNGKITGDEEAMLLLNKDNELVNISDDNGLMSYLGSSKDYRNIQTNMGGKYRIASFLTSGKIAVRSAQSWAVVATDNETDLASMLFLSFLLSDVSQNYLYVQQDNGLPINQTTLKENFAEFNYFIEMKKGLVLIENYENQGKELMK